MNHMDERFSRLLADQERNTEIEDAMRERQFEYRQREANERAVRRAAVVITLATLLATITLALTAAVAFDRSLDIRELEAEKEKAPLQLEIIEPEKKQPAPIYYDVPLSDELQDKLRDACEESGVQMTIALAVIQRETGFRNVQGDGGDSAGYMQVQRKWHEFRMDKLGVTDLNDPEGNFRVGCSYLGELLGKYDTTAEALTAYNSGRPGQSEYADTVLGYAEQIEERSGENNG